MSSELLMLIAALGCAALCVVLIFAAPLLLRNSSKKEELGVLEERNSGFIGAIKPVLRAYSHQLEGKVNSYKLELIKSRLMSAGLIYKISPAEFFVLKRVSALIALAFAVFIILALNMQSLLNIAVTLFLLGLLGFYYPDIWLNDKLQHRQRKIEKEFPFFLDLLVLIMRAGLPFAGAVQQSIEKMPNGPLYDELIRYQRDIRTGLVRADALERLGKRINLPAVTNFVAAIIQAEETGGSITNVLAVQASQRRKERFLKAEKKANEAPVKMLLPLVGLLFPITFIIIGVPIAVEFMNSGISSSLLK